MIVATVPTIVLVLALVGLFARMRPLLRSMAWTGALWPAARTQAWAAPRDDDDPRGTELLLVLAFLVPLLPWVLSTKTPIFGGTKHWFPAYPSLVLLAGAGFHAVAGRLDAVVAPFVRRRWLAPAALGALLVLPPLAQAAHSHPFGLSNYVPLVGGAPGATDLGLNRQFWGFTTGSLVPWFNRHAAPGAGVYIHDTTWEAWEMMQRDGYLRPDLRAVWQPAEGDFSIVHHELHMNEVDYQIWQAYQSPAVDHVLTYDGVPIVSVYRRPPRR
jgi:hypothetical protein